MSSVSRIRARLQSAVTDRVIRRRLRFHETPLDLYRVFLARSVKEYEDAFRLVHMAYVYQGIESPRPDGVRITPQHVLPEATVIVAYEGEHIVGTMTVTVDSPAGLPLEKDYPREIRELRQNGARLVEYGSLAVVKRCWHTGVTNVLNIAAYRVANELVRATHVVIGVNPRAAAVYRAMFNFQILGEPQTHNELQAPVTALVNDMHASQDFVRRHSPQPMLTGYPCIEHFLGRPFPGIELPEQMRDDDFGRWKMPREVFQELFVKHSERITQLDAATRSQLERRRSRATLDLLTPLSLDRVTEGDSPDRKGPIN